MAIINFDKVPMGRAQEFEEALKKLLNPPSPLEGRFSDFAQDPLAPAPGNEFPELQAEFQRISREGLLSPEDMQELQNMFASGLQPQQDALRARVSGDVSRRLGPGRSGAASKAIFNQVDLPFMQQLSDFGRQLFQTNLQSRGVGLSGRQSLMDTLLRAQQDFARMSLNESQFDRSLQEQKRQFDEGQDGGFSVFDLLPFAGPAIEKGYEAIFGGGSNRDNDYTPPERIEY
jgi:hypothetical protein